MPPFSFLSRIKKKAPPERQNNDNPLPQAFRFVHKNKPCATTTFSGTADEIFHIDCHTDPDTQKGFILWDDIQQVSSEVLFIRNGTKVVPFMKGMDLRM